MDLKKRVAVMAEQLARAAVTKRPPLRQLQAGEVLARVVASWNFDERAPLNPTTRHPCIPAPTIIWFRIHATSSPSRIYDFAGWMGRGLSQTGGEWSWS